ncbi:LptA/OstA family protein [Aquifex pyrophilus]
MKLRAFILTLSLVGLAFSQAITGEADSLVYTQDRLIYRGNVKLIKDSSVLNAEEVIIYLNKQGKPVKIVAKGKVSIVEGNRKSFADYLEYDLTKEVIYMRGNAKIVEGKRILEADEIYLYRKEKKLVAKGKKRRVRSVFVEEKK